MRYYVLMLLMIGYIFALAQKEDYAWFIDINRDGNLPAQGLLYDWNLDNGGPVELDMPYGIAGNNASICDSDGNLLFWTNGCAVMNRDQEVMPHGDTLNWDAYREEIGWSSCQRGLPGTQNIKILPNPGNENEFYIFHKARRYFSQFEDITTDLRISYVDMTLDNGNGDITYFDSILYNSPVTPHNLEAIYTDNNSDWWILQPIEDDSMFLTYKLDKNGIEKYPDQHSEVFFMDERSGGGTMRFSPDGTKLAYYEYFLNLHVYDFDRSTGKISNHQKVTIFDNAEEMPNNAYRFGSVEWSPNSRFMYVSVRDSLFQVDGWEEDIEEGIRLIDIYDGTLNPFPNTFYVASLAPDCKIYICSTNGNGAYHVIHQPDELGAACDFVQNGLQLPEYTSSANLPLYPRFRVDEEEKCDSTITSVFGDAVFYRRDLKVYPNPSDGRYTVEMPEQFGSGLLTVVNTKGQIIEQKEIDSGTIRVDIDITSFSSDLYHIELYPKENKDRKFWSKQVVKQ